MTSSGQDLIDWLRLIRSENVGPVTFWQLISRFGTAEAALEALPELAHRGGIRRSIRICSPAIAEAEIAKTEKFGARMIRGDEVDMPKSLASLDPPPPLICVKGDPHFLHTDNVAIVGSRNASAIGRKFAAGLARDLGEAGFTIVSGLARGIDAAAHAGALTSGTVAVLAGGIDHIYPSDNEGLYWDIAGSGALVSEQPIGITAQARDFPRRNRLISGLSLGVVVVEAAKRSGSLITARFALEQGREVLAVPGSPLDPRCAGTNGLIKQGAQLVEGVDDVLSALERPIIDPAVPRVSETTPNLNSPDEQDLEDGRAHLRSLLGPSPIHIDDLSRESRAPLPVVHAVLLELDLAGTLERHPGGRVSIKGSQ